jgi:hypothetical protein
VTRPTDNTQVWDQLVGFDDILVERLRCCTLCGRPEQRSRSSLWQCHDDESGRRLVVATLCCGDCLRNPDCWQALDQKLRLRYGFSLDGKPEVRYDR